MSYFFALNKLLFCPYCRGESLSHVREKLPPVSFNYYCNLSTNFESTNFALTFVFVILDKLPS